MPSREHHARREHGSFVRNGTVPANHIRDMAMDVGCEDYFANLCKRCFGMRLGDNGRGELTCFSCGLVQGNLFDLTPEWWQTKIHTYKRVFYFNERISRMLCTEPTIPDDAWSVIVETTNEQKTKGSIQEINRSSVCQVLKSVKLSDHFMKVNQSKKFKKTFMSKKRFYDKYSEKWKTIVWRLTGKRPRLPPADLVNLLKNLFAACQKPFELYRHASDCDKRYDCDKYFDCWHNFINYDFVIRKLLQIAELKFNWKGCYKQFKDEFLLVSKKVRDKKLRPMFQKICHYNAWPCPDSE